MVALKEDDCYNVQAQAHTQFVSPALWNAPLHLSQLAIYGYGRLEGRKFKYLWKGHQMGEIGTMPRNLQVPQKVPLNHDQVIISKCVIKLLNLTTITTTNKVLGQSTIATVTVRQND